MSNIVKTIVILSIMLFTALGANELHVQQKPCHDFHAVIVYPAIESPLNNSAAGAALAH